MSYFLRTPPRAPHLQHEVWHSKISELLQQISDQVEVRSDSVVERELEYWEPAQHMSKPFLKVIVECTIHVSENDFKNILWES
jgi:hypothetical protein